jgi:hypothetical protein
MPQELVLTPGGRRPKSLVTRVPPGNAIHVIDDTTHLKNLATRSLMEVSMPEVSAEVIPQLGSGWITFAHWTNDTGYPITSFKTTWEVPPVPSSESNQIVFLFNGIDPANTPDGILQPVLQWGVSAAGGGPFWAIASWYVKGNGQAFHSDLVQVDPGDTLVGLMTQTGQTGSQFNYKSEFQGIANTSLQVENLTELVWCNETLEAYSIDDCSDYPSTALTAFREISIETGATSPTLIWTEENSVTDCGQHASVVSNNNPGGEVDLYYRAA